MAETAEPRDGIQALCQRRQRPALDRDGLPVGDQFEVRGERFTKRKISPEASRPGAMRSHQMSEPPRSISTRARLVEAGTRKWDQLIRQIFEVRVRCDVHTQRAGTHDCPAIGCDTREWRRWR